MKAYTYKDSGIEWIGKVPSHWKVDRLRDLSSINTDALSSHTDKDFSLNYLDISNVNSLGVIDRNKIEKISFEHAPSRARRKVEKFDTVISSVRTNLQAVAFIDFDIENLICSTGFFVCRPKFTEILDEKYLYYFLLTDYSKDYFFSHSVGVSYPAIDDYKFSSVNLPLPPLSEQETIVEFLDKAIARIDRIISIKEEQIYSLGNYFTKELTKVITRGIGENVLQDTSCFWLPKIKKGWKLLPLKRLLKTKLKYGANEPALDDNLNHPRYIRITDFDGNGKLRGNTFRSLSPEVAAPYLLTEGDVLFARSGATVGKTFIFKDYDGLACFAGYLIKAECDKNKLLPDFLYYFTKSLSYSEWKDLIFTQATIQNIGADKYQYLNVPVPSVEEQNKIVEFIKILEEATNNAKSNINSQIETLQSYRKSLIHECVTGKKQVTDRIE
ncbi:restriction endonuclease subunit S [Psychrobacter urativorans]|uniref:restriction endonuclease subunit S n=1 Tax=Psychrobacter urativorans TaxID=45610 RepID=UPI001917C7D6|nr:restriction endonuclease subunit S [Psychrobacter urativorans]